MAYTRRKTRKDGTVRWYARYLGTDGRYHEEGGYTAKLAAAKAAAKKQVGRWGLGVPHRGYSYHLDKHFLPRFGALPMLRNYH